MCGADDPRVLRRTVHRFASHRCTQAGEEGQAAFLVLIIVAILIGIASWLFSARHGGERDARAFAKEAAQRIAFDLDRSFIDRVIAPEQVTRYPPSFRERLLERLRGFGRPSGDIEVDGEIWFVSHFFQPSGRFRAALNYSGRPVYLYLAVSRPKGWWQIDDMHVSWEQPAEEPPPATPPAQ